MLITFCFVLKLALMIPNISTNSSSVALEKEKMKGFSLIYLSGDFIYFISFRNWGKNWKFVIEAILLGLPKHGKQSRDHHFNVLKTFWNCNGQGKIWKLSLISYKCCQYSRKV